MNVIDVMNATVEIKGKVDIINDATGEVLATYKEKRDVELKWGNYEVRGIQYSNDILTCYV